MDQARVREAMMRLEHRHPDGSWNRLEPRPQHHDATEHDPERGWLTGQLYACPTCDEQVIVHSPTGEELEEG